MSEDIKCHIYNYKSNLYLFSGHEFTRSTHIRTRARINSIKICNRDTHGILERLALESPVASQATWRATLSAASLSIWSYSDSDSPATGRRCNVLGRPCSGRCCRRAHRKALGPPAGRTAMLGYVVMRDCARFPRRHFDTPCKREVLSACHSLKS